MEILKEKVIELKGEMQFDKIIFKAVTSGENVIIKRTDISDTPECNVKEYVFCDYLKKEEIEIFFDNINITDHIMRNADFGTHYRYGENPKFKFVDVYFTLPSGEMFSDGIWSAGDPFEDPETFNSRDEIPEEDLIIALKCVKEEQEELRLHEIECQKKKDLLPRSVYVSKKFIKLATGLSNKQLRKVDSESFINYNISHYNLEHGLNISKKVIPNAYN